MKVNPHLYNLRQVEEALTELEMYQSFLADITDEEARREMNKNKIKSWYVCLTPTPTPISIL
jgi:hypothetical protein